MKYNVIFQGLNYGGSETVGLSFLSGMGLEYQDKREIFVLSNQYSETLVRDVSSKFGRIIFWNITCYFKFFIKVVRQEKFILVGNSKKVVFYTGLVSKFLGKKIGGLIQVHFHHLGVGNPLVWRIYYRFAISQGYFVCAPSNLVLEEIVALIGCKYREKLILLRNPIPQKFSDLNKSLRNNRSVRDGDRKGLSVGAIGWFIPRKGWGRFFKLVSCCRDDRRLNFMAKGGGDWKQVVWSSDELLDCLEAIGTGRLKIESEGAEVAEFYDKLDVLVLASEQEAVGMVAIEAVCAGVPVVCLKGYHGISDYLDLSECIFNSPRELGLFLGTLTEEGRANLYNAQARSLVLLPDESSYSAVIIQTIG